MRVYALYPSCLGGLRFEQLLETARQEGMVVVDAWKLSMVVHASIALFGTGAQRSRVIQRWAEAGNTLMRRSFPVWSIRTDTPREHWADVVAAESLQAAKIHYRYSQMEVK